MRYLTFGAEQSRYPVALLSRLLRERELSAYVQGFEQDVVAYQITTGPKSKKPELLSYLAELLPALCSLQTDYILCTDGALFKLLTGAQRLDRVAGYVLPCKIKNYEHFHVLYLPSPQQLIYDPVLLQKAEQSLRALKAHREGSYMPPGTQIIHFEEYPDTVEAISQWLIKLVDKDLAIDIEAFSLKHYDAGIATIAMAWNQHEGIAFAVDLAGPVKGPIIRNLLLQFFIERAKRAKTKTLYHKASYDVYVMIYQLFMRDLLDNERLLEGLDVMMTGLEDTLLITYLATNSCSGNYLGLKAQTQEYLGDYSVDVADVRAVPLPRLLTYNLADSLGTWYVYNKRYPTMLHDQQEGVYRDLFLPALKDIIQTQLTGMPVDMEEVRRGKAEMELHRSIAENAVRVTPEVQYLEMTLKREYVDKKNAEYKKKRITVADVGDIDEVRFNFNSPLKLQKLLYTVMGLPVLATTDTGQPSTESDTLKALQHHTQDPNHKQLLKHLEDFRAVDKILNSFIPAFESAQLGPDGWHYLFGFYNLGGTISGRLSSDSPNMQNMPATGSKYAKMIKRMVKAPPGWLFTGLDFNSLEDRISALTTKDPNKLKVYTDGYDGHSLRAFFYFRSQMPDIVDTVESINSIQDKYKPLRQDSKAPTFALTYQGTWRTLMVNCGFTEKQAKDIEKAYHEMYAVSDLWVQEKLSQAAKDGYVTVAFGLRLRTPMLRQCVMGTKGTPYEAVAEGRSAGNALGQSYGLLNSRAVTAFMRDVRASKYRHDIKPAGQIHDAQYYMVRDDLQIVHWVNQTLVPHVRWQELPDIQHDQVKLGGDYSIFYPTWADELVIPNNATLPQIATLAKEHMTRV